MNKNDKILTFCEVEPSWLGKAVHRVIDNTKKYAPDRISFVDDPTAADLIISAVIGLGQIDFLNEHSDKRYAIWQLCLNTTEKPNEPEYWQPIWDKAVSVSSYYDLPVTDTTNFNLTPIGYDPDIFKLDSKMPKIFKAIVTGYVDGTFGEEITEIVNAFPDGLVIHVGGGIGLDEKENYVRVENITDEHMAQLYQKSVYSIGLRYGEGFELPLLEGQACGAIPIAFDIDCYRRWFGDFAYFISQDKPVAEQLREIDRGLPEFNMQRGKYIETDLTGFHWNLIIENFWKRLLERW